ncbi:hypothetical protein EVAR_35862_1 [Eumeta japonica]|uniref:Uncharacterized protein n=1 Tax=Eumeta variegata TaxID=151549 RepID=A0A4C1WVT0_EUMVA|nr:hypothetical protein EVAR_35862_1 [Eumeta japonica]
MVSGLYKYEASKTTSETVAMAPKLATLMLLLVTAKCATTNEIENLDRTLDDLITRIPRCYQDTCSDHERVKRQLVPYCTADSRRQGSILTYVAAVTALGSVGRLVSVQQPLQAIYRYAYLNPAQAGGPVLPLFISAMIRPNSINAQGSRDSDIPSSIRTNVIRMGSRRNRPDGNNDENGHLIAYENGGPYEIYNFAPQPRSLNRGIATGVDFARQSHWRRAEDSINEWVRRGNGYVDQTVVVIYENHLTNPRPVGFAQHVAFYHTNGTLRYECDDFYSNDPTAEPIIHDELQ